jgi:hypothetical protein
MRITGKLKVFIVKAFSNLMAVITINISSLLVGGLKIVRLENIFIPWMDVWRQ